MQQSIIEMIARYRASGLTQRAFAEKEGISIHNFVYYLKRSRDQERLEGGVGFVPLTIKQKSVTGTGLPTTTATLFIDDNKRLVLESVSAEFIKAVIGC